MEIFPAIDISGKKVVRLTQGDYEQIKQYSDKPREIAENFAGQGVKNLHIVDLDGAKDGNAANFEIIREIAALGGFFTEAGGGIRSHERIKAYLKLGINRVILGTAALEHPGFLREALDLYGEKIAVSVDAKDGKAAVRGWREITARDSVEFCKELAAAGVKTIIYTDISKDGELSGANLGIYKRLAAEVPADIIASGGISFLSEITELKNTGVHGAIIGKAIYEGRLDLRQVLACAD
ncbi:MAG: 1-(5-phosphoribosyl)-5-[(5-phosphoribosylamino)methylideneamino]imidazole-4-carboxamide isomerase [Oscillospiraceae bacterium]|jgi:phosphoribosylformimino-5-aminoimidazole carboxamide ribotide isomerase|nr:1-(5-phosphoribosyl)-5-[(5-phosphoribosylamino)methylideneamino]imidazole-4-carboxamide isomerase [Oscillospiraceae bacterium]